MISLESQIRKIDEMIGYLNETASYMNHFAEDVDKAIATQKANGFTQEKAEDYERQYWLPAKAKLEQSTISMTTRHVSYFENVKQKLIQLRNM